LDTIDCLKKNLKAPIEAKQLLMNAENCLNEYVKAVLDFVKCCIKGVQLYISGNGGSAADAQHLAAELVSKLAKNRAPLAAEALTVTALFAG